MCVPSDRAATHQIACTGPFPHTKAVTQREAQPRRARPALHNDFDIFRLIFRPAGITLVDDQRAGDQSEACRTDIYALRLMNDGECAMRICTMVLLGVAIGCSGCGKGDEDPAGYWYKPERSLAQAIHDVRQCVEGARLQQGLKDSGSRPALGSSSSKAEANTKAYETFSDCMHSRGYRRVREESLPPEAQTMRVPAFSEPEPVAGKE